MSSAVERLSVQEALSFPLRGENWQGRFGVGLGLLLASFFIPILPALVVYGYLLRVMRMSIEGQEPSLPEWRDWGDLLGGGFRAFLVGLTYLLPGMLVLSVGTGLYCVASFVLPFAAEAQGGAAGSDEFFFAAFLLAMLIFFTSMAVGSTLTLLGSLPLPVAAGSLAETSQVGSAFRLRQLWRILAANGIGFVTAWVVLIGLWAINYLVMTFAYLTLVLACLIPILLLPLGLYSLLVGAVLFGDAYRVSQQRLA